MLFNKMLTYLLILVIYYSIYLKIIKIYKKYLCLEEYNIVASEKLKEML